MRVMVKFRIPTAGGNNDLKAGKLDKVIPQLMEDLKPEAAYFYPDQGLRAGHFIVQMDESSQVLEITERVWYAFGGDVEMTPVMSAEDIQKAIPSAAGIAQKYA
jgi:hypothetical protein